MEDCSPTTLYRLFSGDGTLLYIGIAGNPGRRFEQHKKNKPWWGEVAEIKLEHFPDRPSCLTAEADAIKVENPKHNVIHNRRPVPTTPRSHRIERYGSPPLIMARWQSKADWADNSSITVRPTWVIKCPYCRGRHSHGAGPGHRSAHCFMGITKNGTTIDRHPDADFGYVIMGVDGVITHKDTLEMFPDHCDRCGINDWPNEQPDWIRYPESALLDEGLTASYTCPECEHRWTVWWAWHGSILGRAA